MKNTVKLIGILAITVLIGFGFWACGDDGGGSTFNPPVGPTPLTGTISINGNAQVGEMLTADTSVLGGSGEISYQWERDYSTVIGNNDSTYMVQNNDVSSTITVTVTRSDNSGSITSDPTDVITPGDLPVLTGTVSITGNAIVGEKLTVNTSKLGGDGWIDYYWKRDGHTVGYDDTYSVQEDDVGSTITVTVTRSENSGSVTSVPTSIIHSPLTGTVSITGDAYVGLTLTANTTGLGGNGTITYQWKRGNTNIGANSNTYKIVNADAGSTITVTITRSGNSGSFESAPTDTIPFLIFTLINNNKEYSVSGIQNIVSAEIPEFCNELPVTTIGSSAFYNMVSLTNVTIPDSVTSIGQYAFYGCTGLISITIHEGLTSIGSGAFDYTNVSITWYLNLEHYYNHGYSFTSTFIYYVNSIIISNGVTSIIDNFFYQMTWLISITIPDSVTSIGQNAFNGCTGLTNITIPDSVTNIGSGAFAGCTGLSSVTISNRVTSISNYAFSGCTSLTSIIIPNSVTSIGGYAFNNCISLKSIMLPNSVTSISQSAFNGCTGLTSITLPNNITSIEDYTFSGCNSLASIIIPDSVKTIRSYVFIGCTSLTSITMPNIVGTSGSYPLPGNLLNIYWSTGGGAGTYTTINPDDYYNSVWTKQQ